MGYAETILQAARTWHTTATGLAAGKVIPADDKGDKPALPFLTVRFVPGSAVGVDEVREHADGHRVYSQRRGTLTVHAFGKQTDALEEYLDAAALALPTNTTIIAALDAAGISVERYGPIVEVPPGLVDTTIQRHLARDYVIAYAIAPTAATVDAVDVVEVAATYHDTEDVDDDANTLDDTITVSGLDPTP